MSKVTQSLVAHDGKYIVMPPHKEGQEGWGNLVQPGVCIAGGDAIQQYPVNTKFVDFDRTFIYGYVSVVSTVTKAALGIMNSNVKESIQWGATAGAIGDTLIGLLESAMDVETEAAANVFAGGYIMLGDTVYEAHRIVGNTAYNLARESTEIDITIEEPGLGSVQDASTDYGFMEKNPYTALVEEWLEEEGDKSVMGITLILPTALRYQWIQTWGPCFVLGDETVGSLIDVRQCVFNRDGSIVSCGQNVPSATQQRQHAGYAISDTKATDTYAGTWYIQLQLEK